MSAAMSLCPNRRTVSKRCVHHRNRRPADSRRLESRIRGHMAIEMRSPCVGGVPAGLYFATLWKTRHPKDDVQVYEQTPADATFGFGVVFSDRALEVLRDE